MADAYNKYGEEYRAMYNKGKYKHAGFVKEVIPTLPDIDRASRDEIRELTKTTFTLKNIALKQVDPSAPELSGYITVSVLVYILLL